MAKPFDLQNHHRRSTRLPGRDYSAPGRYFITICAREHACLFGDIIDGKVVLSKVGTIAGECWQQIPLHFAHVTLDAWVIMPNHLHGILVLHTGQPFADDIPTPSNRSMATIGFVINAYKASVSRLVNRLQENSSSTVWQRGYYDRVLRGSAELERIRWYITRNPANWETDEERLVLTSTENRAKIGA